MWKSQQKSILIITYTASLFLDLLTFSPTVFLWGCLLLDPVGCCLLRGTSILVRGDQGNRHSFLLHPLIRHFQHS